MHGPGLLTLPIFAHVLRAGQHWSVLPYGRNHDHLKIPKGSPRPISQVSEDEGADRHMSGDEEFHDRPMSGDEEFHDKEPAERCRDPFWGSGSYSKAIAL